MRLLLVDGDPDALMKSADALRRQYPDAQINATTDAMDAVQYSLNHPVDAVYTEVLMPRCSGFDVVRLVRKFHPQAATYILSATERFAAQAQNQRIRGYLLKSVLWAQTDGREALELTEDELNWVAAAGESERPSPKQPQ